MEDILVLIKRYFEQQRQERIVEIEKYFGGQKIDKEIVNLDVQGLRNILENGLNVPEYEKNRGSIILKVLIAGFIRTMLDGLKELIGEDYLVYFYREYSITETSNLPLEVQRLLSENVEKLLGMIRILYENGADVNLSVNVNGEIYTLFSIFVILLNYFKSLDVITFFLNNPSFDVNLNLKSDFEMMTTLVFDDSNLSTEVLQKLVNLGLPYSISPSLASIHGDLDLNFNFEDLINPIAICLDFAERTKKSKLNIIYPIAPFEQQKRYARTYKKMNMGDEDYLNLLESQVPEIVEVFRKFMDKIIPGGYILESRVKSLEKINLKVYYLEEKDGKSIGVKGLRDIIGLRISLYDEESIPSIVGSLMRNKMCVDHIDYFYNPKPNGFKADLLYYRWEIEGINFIFELQVMTKEMRDFAEATHEEHDREKYNIRKEETPVV